MRRGPMSLEASLTASLAALAGTLLLAAPARAAEWRYCYALDADGHRFAVTEPFATNEPSPALEAALRRHFADRGAEPKGSEPRGSEPKGIEPKGAARMACPRADTREQLLLLRRAAGDYQREQHNTVVPLEWSPGETVARR